MYHYQMNAFGINFMTFLLWPIVKNSNVTVLVETSHICTQYINYVLEITYKLVTSLLLDRNI